MDVMRLDAEAEIKQHGGRIVTTSGGAGLNNRKTFGCSYRVKDVAGDLHVVVHDLGGDRLGLFVFVHEHQVRP
jgi:hypothetical protein